MSQFARFLNRHCQVTFANLQKKYFNSPTLTHIVTATNQNQLPQSPDNVLIDPEEDSFTNQNQLLQSLEDSWIGSEGDDSMDASLPEIPMRWNLCS